MIHSNAETQDISGGCDKRINQDQSGRLGKTRDDGPIYGHEEQSRSIASDCTGRHTTRTNFDYGDSPSGKILQRLDKLEETHYQYVHAHQNRLRARLDESEKLEEQFRQEAAELREQILALASEDEKPEIESK
ncbi:MAG: hypothetical protein V7K64_01735 [Nostoc sp.]|uniref:hypothetical protein n=1 Tax=Nostoc sp. TaxID=1180 RepID=UPI002FF062FE